MLSCSSYLQYYLNKLRYLPVQHKYERYPLTRELLSARDGNYTVAILSFQVVGVGDCGLHIQLSIADPIEHGIVDGFFSNSVTPALGRADSGFYD
jgi:hypothetical protein